LPPCGKWNQRICSGEVRSVGGQRLGQNGHGRNIYIYMAVCDYNVARQMVHGKWFSYFPEV
jgi:hypothetical protein